MPAKAKAVRRYINLPDRKTPLPFSDAVPVGDALYLWGRIGIDPETGVAPGDVDAELRLLFDGFEAVLSEDEVLSDSSFNAELVSLRDGPVPAYKTQDFFF
jgi:enamine deaminase RidA (YjgF/YER057c/UK114 family)